MADDLSFEIRGLREVNAKLEELQASGPEAFARALYEESEIIMTESKRRVPVDTGALRGTGHVDPPSDDGSVRLAYGDSTVDYALRVHEDLDARHDDGEAKYLERPVLEALPNLAERVARRMAALIGR